MSLRGVIKKSLYYLISLLISSFKGTWMCYSTQKCWNKCYYILLQHKKQTIKDLISFEPNKLDFDLKSNSTIHHSVQFLVRMQSNCFIQLSLSQVIKSLFSLHILIQRYPSTLVCLKMPKKGLLADFATWNKQLKHSSSSNTSIDVDCQTFFFWKSNYRLMLDIFNCGKWTQNSNKKPQRWWTNWQL